MAPRQLASNGKVICIPNYHVVIIDLELPNEKWEECLKTKTYRDFGVNGVINVFKK